MRQASDILAALDAFDGTRVAPLREVLRDTLAPEAEAALIDAIPGPEEVAASWLVKALAETGRLGQGRLAVLFERLASISAEDASLHLLQCAQHAPDAARLLRPYLPPFYQHRKILLRVWAFDAYCRGVDLPSEFDDIAQRIAQCLHDRSAAMRARSRALAIDFGVDLENGPKASHLS